MQGADKGTLRGKFIAEYDYNKKRDNVANQKSKFLPQENTKKDKGKAKIIKITAEIKKLKNRKKGRNSMKIKENQLLNIAKIYSFVF